MGLDMYLYGITKDNTKSIYDKSKGTWEEVLYWRKANQIHKFFHDKFIQPKNPWGLYEVSPEVLDELRIKCLFVLMNKDSEEGTKVALALLPPDTNGCFFGTNEIGELYFDQIEETHNALTELLESEKYQSFFYQASW